MEEELDPSEEEIYRVTPKGALWLLLTKEFDDLDIPLDDKYMADMADRFELGLYQFGFVILPTDQITILE